ncbi:MAG: tetratricopeptide repeat protein [Bdellovibrionota bacterium]
MVYSVTTLESIIKSVKNQDSMLLTSFIEGACGESLAKIEGKFYLTSKNKSKKIAFVAAQLPHPCELELWNASAKKSGHETVLFTSQSEEKNFKQFVKSMEACQIPVSLSCTTLESMQENKTFLSGLEKELESFSLIVSVGENSLASYQAAKAKRQNQARLVIWQNSARPPHANVGARTNNGAPLPNIAREKTVRKEVLKNADVVLCFDKDGATWSYLEDVSSQRIRRLSRCINPKRYSEEISTIRRLELRASLGLPETDFIFLHLGPLEIESGSLDSVYAFKNLLQSNPSFQGHARLCFCGSGSAGADIRQTVVELGLDDHVYFLNPSGDGVKELVGNQFSNIISLCDAVIHAPISPVNGNALKHLDSTYDLLCALSSGLIVISNGSGWIGEWVSRFYKIFASGCIHSLGRMMQETIEKQDKLVNVKKAITKAIENEFQFEKVSDELVQIFRGFIAYNAEKTLEDSVQILEQIEEMVAAKQYIDAIQLIAQAFQKGDLTVVQQSNLFRIIGDCFTKLGDLDSGVTNYTRASDMDPYCAKSFIGLGTVALQRNDYNIAVPHFQKAVTLAPNDDMASLGLGLAFEGLGELNEALKWTARSCHLNSESTVAIYNLVKLSYELQNFTEVQKALERYVGRHPNDVNMIYTLGGIYFSIGSYQAALDLMENIIALDPMNSRAHALISEIGRRSLQRQPA